MTVTIAEDVLLEGESQAPVEVLTTSGSDQHITPAAQAPKTPPQSAQPLPAPTAPRVT